jgi:hypothetical protein
VNKKSQGNEETIRDRGRASGIVKEVTRQLKSMDKQTGDAEKNRKQPIAPIPAPQ